MCNRGWLLALKCKLHQVTLAILFKQIIFRLRNIKHSVTHLAFLIKFVTGINGSYEYQYRVIIELLNSDRN